MLFWATFHALMEAFIIFNWADGEFYERTFAYPGIWTQDH